MIQMQGAEKAAPETYRAYDEGDAEAPQRSRWIIFKRFNKNI